MTNPQFIEEKDNEKYFQLIEHVKKITGFGVVINTSFNFFSLIVLETKKNHYL